MFRFWKGSNNSFLNLNKSVNNELPSVHMTYFIGFFQIVFWRPSEMFCWPTLLSSSSSLKTSVTRTRSWTCASLPSTTTTNPPSFRTWTSSRSRIIWSSKMLTRCHKVWATRCDSGLRWSLTSAISKSLVRFQELFVIMYFLISLKMFWMKQDANDENSFSF